MRKWEIAATILAVLAVLGTTVGAFAYQGYRDSKAPEVASRRSAGMFIPQGDPVAGKQVYAKSCAACHGINAQGASAPDLRGVAAGGSAFLYAWVLDPHTVSHQATMPRIPLTEQEIADVVAYMMVLPSLPAEAQVPPEPAATPAPKEQKTVEPGVSPPTQLIAKGEELYNQKGCAACHGKAGVGTTIGPPLPGYTNEQVKAQVRNPKGTMPRFTSAQISDQDLEAIANYIESLRR